MIKRSLIIILTFQKFFLQNDAHESHTFALDLASGVGEWFRLDSDN